MSLRSRSGRQSKCRSSCEAREIRPKIASQRQRLTHRSISAAAKAITYKREIRGCIVLGWGRELIDGLFEGKASIGVELQLAFKVCPAIRIRVDLSNPIRSICSVEGMR